MSNIFLALDNTRWSKERSKKLQETVKLLNLKIMCRQVKDVRLPQSLQRAMAAEAEAAREARAKVTILLFFMMIIAVSF